MLGTTQFPDILFAGQKSADKTTPVISEKGVVTAANNRCLPKNFFEEKLRYLF